ncbi:hypothetical protein [Brevundimonas sp. Root1279]|uniref:hypothetical protein n=1 Tax=Brevundimonas sp. Root1279 TaxID=1736443 RepID=UPI0006F39D15|nr:hypothetical protein [Brevundimonas sp. Root1279]KQW79749.1 hypothetical protein ASC65_14470 [Brevundimonas sp. Root1279]
MNRDRLSILRRRLSEVSDERFDIRHLLTNEDGQNEGLRKDAQSFLGRCGTAACIAGWANSIWGGFDSGSAMEALDLSEIQGLELFEPAGFEDGGYTRADAIAAIQSMLDNPADDALPVWPEAPQ